MENQLVAGLEWVDQDKAYEQRGISTKESRNRMSDSNITTMTEIRW